MRKSFSILRSDVYCLISSIDESGADVLANEQNIKTAKIDKLSNERTNTYVFYNNSQGEFVIAESENKTSTYLQKLKQNFPYLKV